MNNTIFLPRGNTKRLVVEIKNPDGTDYVPTKNDEVCLTVRKYIDSDVLLRKYGVNITIEPEDTKELECGKYVYDIRLKMPSGEIYTLLPPSEFIVAEEVYGNE